MLKLDKISKTFIHSDGSTIEAINKISLDVKEGEFVIFVGPSGCGKTTLLKVIAGLENPSNGKAVFNNKEIKSSSWERGMIFQHFTLFPWLSVAENIAFGLRLKNVDERKITETMAHYLKITGLEQFRNRYPLTLSGGMQQRVAIARTLANNPKILLLDEPFGALDVQTRSQMQEFLAKLWEEEQKTMVLVTHDVEEAVYLADKIVVLSIKPGTIKEVINVSLPRPRRTEIRFEEDFLRLKKHITYLIRSETLKAALQITPSIHQDVLKIGTHIWPGNSLFYLAKDKGLFIKNNLESELISLEKDEDRIKAWESGQVDVLNVTLDTAIQLRDRISDLKILTVLNRSFGGDAIIANPSINSIKELKGKRIGLEKGWAGHFFLLYVLNKFGLSSKDVKIIDTKGSDIGSAIISNQIDAGVLWEPWLSKAKEFSGAKILATTREYPVVYDVLVVKEKVYKKEKKEIEKLDKIWEQSIEIFKKNKSEAVKTMASYLYVSETELSDELKQLEFLDKSSNKLSDVIKEIQSILLKEKLIKEGEEFKNLVV